MYNATCAVPKYCQIKSMIIKMIKSGKLKENMKVFSESTLGREFGVNRNTVAKALNELALEGYILRKQGMGSFVAPRKKKQRTGNIGVLVEDVENRFYSLIAKHVENVAKSNGYNVILCNTKGIFDIEKESIEGLIENNKVDGLIVTPTDLVSQQEQDFFRSLQKQNIPIVFLFSQYLPKGFNLMTPDYNHGFSEAVNLLVNSGKRKISCVITNHRNDYGIEQRIAGYKHAADFHNIEYSIMEVASAIEEEGYNLSKKIAEGSNRPNGIIAVNDATAIGLLKGFRETGIRVPEDIAIVGFDDIEYASDTNIQLTTMRHDYSRMCNVAVHTILKQYEEPNMAPVKIKIPMEAVIRKTCIPAYIESNLVS